MSKIYYPEKVRMVPATGHAPGTEYKVSYGTEYWDDRPHKVYKVQMVYDGQVSGRRSPSYLADTDDYIKVNEAMNEIIEEVKNGIFKDDDNPRTLIRLE